MENIKYWDGQGFPDEPSKNTVEISFEKWAEMVNAQGKIIVSDENGYPVLIEPEPAPYVPPAQPEPTEIELSMMGAIAELYERTLK